jgi:hypothetical protein
MVARESDVIFAASLTDKIRSLGTRMRSRLDKFQLSVIAVWWGWKSRSPNN